MKYYLIVFVFILFYSCLPYHPNERNRTSRCIFLSPKSFEIIKTCDEYDKISFTGIKVTMEYDSIYEKHYEYLLYEKQDAISFPYKLPQKVIDSLNGKMRIWLYTRVESADYLLFLHNADLKKDKIPFRFFYNDLEVKPGSNK